MQAKFDKAQRRARSNIVRRTELHSPLRSVSVRCSAARGGL